MRPAPRRSCAFLSTDSLEGFVVDDDLAVEPLEALGWAVERVPWRRSEDWRRFDAVVIRSPWDYQQAPDAFLDVLAAIDRSGTRLVNGLDLVRWNLRKTYLRELADRGVDVVPTLWRPPPLDAGELPAFYDRLEVDELVIKPVVSANADHTYRLPRATWRNHAGELAASFRARHAMVQPFLDAVVDEGELSLFYFGGEHSHTILKTPKPRDFRVQEEHGGRITAVDAEPALLDAGRRAMSALPGETLYARVDLVRVAPERFWLMEVELIEPALYFRMDVGAPARFAHALTSWVG